ncbi:MAG TPA: hypothetical protein VGG64_18460 [Pirellulales bacterium]
MGANELTAAVQVAVVGHLSYTVFREGIFAHATTADGLTAQFSAAPAGPDSR